MKQGVIYKEPGTPYLIPELPEEPRLCEPFKGSPDGMKVEQCAFPLTNSCPCGMRWFSYTSALESAIASAIPVAPECRELVLDLCWRNDRRINGPIPFQFWKENMLGQKYKGETQEVYPVEGIEFEVKMDQCKKWCGGAGCVPERSRCSGYYPSRRAIIRLLQKPEPVKTVTDQLKEMAATANLSNDARTFAVHEAGKEAFKTLFVYFHGLGLRSHIDLTMEQDGVNYQLLFKPVSEPVVSEIESKGQADYIQHAMDMAKRQFIETYAMNREGLNMRDSLAKLYDTYVSPLQSEMERLKNNYDAAKSYIENLEKAMQERSELKAENARLREALTNARDYAKCGIYHNYPSHDSGHRTEDSIKAFKVLEQIDSALNPPSV